MLKESHLTVKNPMEKQGKVYQDAIDASMMLSTQTMPSFDDLSEDFPEESVPLLDRKVINEQSLSQEQKQFRENGVLILDSFIPESIVDAYLDLRKRCNIGSAGWGTPTPYLFFDEIKDLCLYKPLSDIMKELIGDEMGMHFNIPMFKSTERFWHQDDYLNPPQTHSWYLGVWFALGDIHPDCGPFEYVPQSHKWPCMRSHLVKQHLKPEAREVYGLKGEKGHWAQYAEAFTNKAYQEQLNNSGLQKATFLGKKGDVLIWHGKLLHRGSVPNNADLIRPAIITHYSSTSKRKDLGERVIQHKNGGYYWDFEEAYLSNWPDVANMERMRKEIYELSLVKSRYQFFENLREKAKQYPWLKKFALTLREFKKQI